MDNELSALNQTLEQLLVSFLEFLPELIASLVIFLVSLYLAGWVSRALKRVMQKRAVDYELSLAIAAVTRWSIVVLGTTAALNQIGFDLTAFLTGLGIIGFTIGFAIQDVSKNFVAGLLLLLQQPFDIGDAIEVAGFGGTVLKVDLRATELRTFDGRLVQIPNADVFTSAVVNFSRADKRRVSLDVGVAYGSDLKQARGVALEAIVEVEGVLEEPAPQVVVHTFGESSVDMTVYYWVDTGKTSLFEAQTAGVLAIEAAFERAGIEIPYPVRTVLLQQMEP